MPVAQASPASSPPSPKQPLQEVSGQSQGSALLPAPSFAHTDRSKEPAGVTIGSITNAYFTTAPESRPGSAWNATQLASAHSLGQLHAAAPGLLTEGAAPGVSQNGAGLASIGNAWQPYPVAANLWQQRQASVMPRAEAISPSQLSSSFGAFADSPAQDFSTLGTLGNKRSSSIPAEGGAQGILGVGVAFNTGGLFGDGVISSAASSASSKRHKTAHLSSSSANLQANSAIQIPTQSLAHTHSAVAAQGKKNTHPSNDGSGETQQPADKSHEGEIRSAGGVNQQTGQSKPNKKNRSPYKSPPRYHFDR